MLRREGVVVHSWGLAQAAVMVMWRTASEPSKGSVDWTIRVLVAMVRQVLVARRVLC